MTRFTYSETITIADDIPDDESILVKDFLASKDIQSTDVIGFLFPTGGDLHFKDGIGYEKTWTFQDQGQTFGTIAEIFKTGTTVPVVEVMVK